MIDDDFKNELGSFEQAHLGFDMGDGKEFKGFAICNGKLHVLFTLETDLTHHPLNCEPAMSYLDGKTKFSEILKDFAFKEAREYAINKRKNNGK